MREVVLVSAVRTAIGSFKGLTDVMIQAGLWCATNDYIWDSRPKMLLLNIASLEKNKINWLAKRGLATLCIGGGQGTATIIELL